MIAWVLMASLLGNADSFLGAPLVPGSRALEDAGRYGSPRSYESTVEFYEKQFKNGPPVRWRHIVNVAGLRAKHVQNLNRKSRWQGINIYELKGKVRYYVVPRHTIDGGSTQG